MAKAAQFSWPLKSQAGALGLGRRGNLKGLIYGAVMTCKLEAGHCSPGGQGVLGLTWQRHQGSGQRCQHCPHCGSASWPCPGTLCSLWGSPPRGGAPWFLWSPDEALPSTLLYVAGGGLVHGQKQANGSTRV